MTSSAAKTSSTGRVGVGAGVVVASWSYTPPTLYASYNGGGGVAGGRDVSSISVISVISVSVSFVRVGASVVSASVVAGASSPSLSGGTTTTREDGPAPPLVSARTPNAIVSPGGSPYVRVELKGVGRG